ncbi:hypothetical protein Leryth_021635 [Lithospermum erythrorhizon]|nr:hypothetical protein Leryth_021635 [Lithospermum erythrorhizon]
MPQLLSWTKPKNGSLKLNVDATFKGGQAGYGGILGDHHGHLIFSIGEYGTNSSPLEAEIEALYLWLRACIKQGYNRPKVEVDSILLVKKVRDMAAHWQVYNKVNHIATMVESSGSSMVHIHRERNMAADWIAKNSLKKKGHYIWEASTTNQGM